ncbi:pseudaminic acid synthase [Nisaea acidiphila]|uniref:Pseudaminic acid synthase n=1 Tax=Nisaea acidiphila TaxID=1862145 RepID=A0A9J7AXB9_9PROT|nr:pseudaminic acid synthase [Nisaea acidiphila]UUX51434.1 pseudaminic acid synthase [Nisaea acidiphila]
MAKDFKIDGRPVGPEHPPYVVAEMSGNHNGEIGRALALIDAAKEAGADAVKIQTYRADTITIDHDGPEFMIHSGLWAGRRLFELYEEAHTPWEWHAELFQHARKIGITLFSAPFDPTAVELLQSLGCPAFKIASPEIVDLDLVERCARTGKPLIISTGMASLEEIEDAVATARGAGAKDILVLHCISGYPTPVDQANLATIPDLASRLDVAIGLSDHTMDTVVAEAAVAMGAVLVEKHFTLRRADGGVDSAFSLEPEDLATLVRNLRTAFDARGKPNYRPTDAEKEMLSMRRSLYVVADIAAGEALTEANIRSIRPANGLPPKYLRQVIGKTATRQLKRGEPLAADMVSGFAT